MNKDLMVEEAIYALHKREQLRNFCRESNKIEGIIDEEANDTLERETQFILSKSKLLYKDIVLFAGELGGEVRNKEGLNVRVGNHFPISGGVEVEKELKKIISKMNKKGNPYTMHMEFENLHPFTDGNGRTGRMLWLWQMVNQCDYGMELGFLHKYYYQSLEMSRYEN